jgi:hypothetical protein
MGVEVNRIIFGVELLIDLIENSKSFSEIIEVEICFGEVEIKIVKAENRKAVLILFDKMLRFQNHLRTRMTCSVSV